MHQKQISGFAQYLISNSLLPESLVHELLRETQEENISFISALIAKDIIDSKKIAVSIANYFNLPIADFDQLHVQDLPFSVIDEKLIVKHRVLPIRQIGKDLHLAIADPTDTSALNEIKFHTQLNIQPIVAEYRKLNQRIDTWLQDKAYFAIENNQNEYDAPIIKFIDDIFAAAIEKNASDIHFEPCFKAYRIRFRIDGLLHEIIKADLALMPRFSARIKVLARLNIAEKRLPQDGRFTLQIHKYGMRDCRINICPVLSGEKIVIRILQSQNVELKIAELGMSEKQQQIFLQSINRPEGLILVTGPTGSGKTNTLYTALQILNIESKNIMTVEDPVEITLPGINQVEVKPKIDLTFAAVLRAFLRQDPDIIMIGEIRDLETAQMAIRAAQTGHLVVATLHTNSAVEAITRLLNMGIVAYNLSSSLSLIIAQRLVRKLCSYCKTEKSSMVSQSLKIDSLSLAEPLEQVFQANGCEHCHKGYQGRTGIFELLPFTMEMGKALMEAGNVSVLYKFLQQEGNENLRTMAIQKVKHGKTSLEEVFRVIGD